MSTYLLTGRWIITGEPGLHQVIEGGAVYVEDDRIVEIGERKELARRHGGATVLGGESSAIMPGLINAHHHSHATTTIQHGISDQLLEPWILSFRGQRNSDIYLNTLLSAARQLASGVTTVVDVHSCRAGADYYEEQVSQALKAYETSGLRVAFATGTSTQSLLVHGKGQDEVFVDQLPEPLGKHVREQFLSGEHMDDDDYLSVVSEKVKAYKDHDRIDVWFAPPGPQWVSDELMQRISQRAESLDTNVQTHCNESMYEMVHGLKFYDCPSVVHLHRLGVLSPRFSIAHGVWLKREEIDVLAETGAAVSHNPSSNLRLRAGIAPLNALVSAGVTTALGMDGTTINEDEDMFNELRLAARLQRDPTLGARIVDIDETLTMATRGGARLMRKETELGRIAPGFKADLVVLDIDRITWPWVAPEMRPKELIVSQAARQDVSLVMANGRIVYRDGRPTGFDLQAAAESLAQSLEHTPYPSAGAALADELAPHLERWYKSWHGTVLSPYIRYNSAT